MMIGNNNFYFNYNNFLLNNNNFISPSQNVGNNNFNKKSDNTTKANIDTSSFSQDTEINENDNNSALNSLSSSLSNIADTSNLLDNGLKFEKNNKVNDKQKNVTLPTIVPPPTPPTLPPFEGTYEPNRLTGNTIDINKDGKPDANISDISKGAMDLVGNETNVNLDPNLVGKRESFVCTEVPYYAYKDGANIDMKKLFSDFDKNNPGILDRKNSIEEDNTSVTKVQNWHRFFYKNNLLFDSKSPYQAGDVLFIKPKTPNNLSEIYHPNDPTHSAIVTKVDKYGNPLEVVGASWGTKTVKTYTWEEWQKVTKNYIDMGHGGFRPPSYYLSPQIPTFTPTPNPEQKVNTEPQSQPLPTPGNN